MTEASQDDDKSETICRVCGFSDGDLYRDEGGWPTDIICPCCGAQSGIHDGTLDGVRAFRGYWVGQGAAWDTPEVRPENWDLIAQISSVPPAWR
ncbi:hypothetical protein [Streptomyces sp. NPDC086787]|uniref:hypothetical protein n=1 Tax=Streptomyces sp. NPDC086787 TaxID=3365759 RepID=UPI003825DB76